MHIMVTLFKIFTASFVLGIFGAIMPGLQRTETVGEIAQGVATGRRHNSGRIYRGIVGVWAVFLIVFACYFGY